MKYKLITICLGLMLFTGCVKSTDTSGNTQIGIDPNKAAKIEPFVAAGQAGAAAVSVVWPPATIIAGLLSVVLAGIAKAKTNQLNTTYAATTEIVNALEQIKESNPALWAQIKEKIKMGTTQENVIRAILGKPELK
jgi:hypothetical protein